MVGLPVGHTRRPPCWFGLFWVTYSSMGTLLTTVIWVSRLLLRLSYFDESFCNETAIILLQRMKRGIVIGKYFVTVLDFDRLQSRVSVVASG